MRFGARLERMDHREVETFSHNEPLSQNDNYTAIKPVGNVTLEEANRFLDELFANPPQPKAVVLDDGTVVELP